uniref:SpoIIE family protein phosphatase n=1 Tax=Kitasatospora aureofaciens TaxID=1894 RepID=UPI0035A83653
MNASSGLVGGGSLPFSDVAAAVVDGDGVVLQWSRTAAQLLDRTAAEVCGQPLAQLIETEHRDPDTSGGGRTPTAGRAVLRHRSGRPVEVAYHALRLDGSYDVLLLATPVQYAGDWAQGTAGAAALFTDAAERGRRRDLRHEASARIGDSLDVLRTAQDLVDVLVPAFGDLAWASLADPVLDGDEPPKLAGAGAWHMRRVAAASVGPWPAGFGPPGVADPPMPDLPVLRRVQRGETVLVPDRASALAMAEGHPELIPLLIPEHGHSAVSAPLFARGLVLGAVAVWRTEHAEAFDQADADLLTEIVSRAALSVDNARRYTREHRAVVALQQRLLPRATTDDPAAETAGLYRPAGGGADIGGDWFDVIPLPSLRVAFVIGDVVGHGLHAAATMGRLRTAIQTLADLEMEPDELLTHLDDLVQQLAGEAPHGHQEVIGATCLYAVYDPVTRHCALASAGHLPPVVVRPDAAAHVLEVSPGPPLGVGGMPFEVTETVLPPGSVLALYTDGLVERDHADLGAGIRRLTENLGVLCRRDRPLDDIGRALLADTGNAPPRPATTSPCSSPAPA